MNRILPHPVPVVPPQTVLVVASLAWSLVNFRLDLMRRMLMNGHRVLAAAPDFDTATETTLRENGILPLTISMERTGLDPWQDLRTLGALRRLIRVHRPGLVLPYTMKPIVYACLAARIEGGTPCIPLFTGLGYAFSQPRPSGRRRLVRAIAIRLHRLATKDTRMAFCYNSAEQRDLRRFRMVPDAAQLIPVPGSGVDTDRFRPLPMPAGMPAFLFIGRMLRSKGLEDLLAAAQQLRTEGHVFRLDLVGPLDSNPDAVEIAALRRWHEAGQAAYHGPTRDVRPFLHDCHVFVLPTKLREGVPRAILEAMACGRPVITTDAPGCGDTIEDSQTGFAVPVGDVQALAAAMRRFLKQPDLATQMGMRARERVVQAHDVHLINRLLLTRMGLEAEAISAAQPRLEALA